MITVEKIGVESRIDLKIIDSLEISVKPNQHVKTTLSGILNKSTDVMASDWEGSNIQIVKLNAAGKPEMLLFSGVVETIYVYVENGVSRMIATALSYSSLLDKSKKRHSYQEIGMTYRELIQDIIHNQNGKVDFYGADTSYIQKPMIQYMETDWVFCQRLASHLGLPVYCNPTSQGIALQIGIAQGKKRVMEIGKEYQVSIKPENFVSKMMTTYNIKSYENYSIGDLVSGPAGNMYIYEKM